MNFFQIDIKKQCRTPFGTPNNEIETKFLTINASYIMGLLSRFTLLQLICEEGLIEHTHTIGVSNKMKAHRFGLTWLGGGVLINDRL